MTIQNLSFPMPKNPLVESQPLTACNAESAFDISLPISPTILLEDKIFFPFSPIYKDFHDVKIAEQHVGSTETSSCLILLDRKEDTLLLCMSHNFLQLSTDTICFPQ